MQQSTPSAKSFESIQSKGTESTPIAPVLDLNNLSNIDKHIEEINSCRFSADSKIGSQTEALKGFPIDSLPNAVIDIVKQKSNCLGFPIDLAAGAHLHAAATAIGNTYRSNWMGGYKVTTNLFMTIVGPPGSNKSEPLKDAYREIEKRDGEEYEEFERKWEEWEAAKAAFGKEQADNVKKPILTKRIVSDATIEAIAQVSYNNKRGICSLVDEQAGFIKDMNKYSSGGVQEQWLSIFNCTPFNSDRIGRKSVRVANPCISLIGTIQPATLDELAKDNRNENGFRDRLLFIWPENLNVPVWSRKRIDESVNVNWSRILGRLFSLDFSVNPDGKEVPNYIPFTADAEEALITWQESNIAKDQETDSQLDYSISAKIYIYVLRFALINQLLRWACGEAERDAIDATSANNAIKQAQYFKHQALKVARYINSKSPIDRLTQNKKSIYKALPISFTTAEGVAIADRLGMPKRTFEYWIANDNKLFTKLDHGEYKRDY